MSFLNPIMLIGLAGVAVPIIMHLLNRLRHRRIEWAAMELLRRAVVSRSRQVKIEDWLLLALRVLAVGLIALAMARPTFRTESLHVGQQQVGVVIALDASYSMGHQPGVARRFDRALELVRDIEKTLAPGYPVTVMLMGDSPHMVFAESAYEEQKFQKAIGELKPLPERLNPEICLERMASLAAEMRRNAPVVECYLISDGQALSWGSLSAKARQSLDEMRSAADTRVFFLAAGGDDCENLAIRNLAFRSGRLAKGGTARYVAEVQNWGRRAQDRVPVSLMLDETTVDQQIIDRIEPGRAVPVALFARFDKPGIARLTARIGPDALPLDNERYAVAVVRDQIKVLCVDGDPAPPPAGGATAFLAKALAPRPGSRFAATIETVPWVELDRKQPAGYDVIVLANVPSIRQEKAAELATFVARGGGLIVFLGDKIIPRVLNGTFDLVQGRLLPGEVVEKLTAPQETVGGWTMQPGGDHALAGLLRMLPPPLVEEARVKQMFRVRPVKDAVAIFKIAENGEPLLLERRVGQGKVLLAATSADRKWTNLPNHPLYAMLLQEALTYLTRRPYERSYRIDEPLVCPLPRESTQSVVMLKTPAGETQPIQVSDRDGGRMADCGKPEAPGFYDLTLAEDNLLSLAVNVDPTEGDVRVLPGDELAKAMTALGVRLIEPGTNLTDAIRESRVGRELWWQCMLVALGVLLVEMFLARRFSGRVSTAESVL